MIKNFFNEFLEMSKTNGITHWHSHTHCHLYLYTYMYCMLFWDTVMFCCCHSISIKSVNVVADTGSLSAKVGVVSILDWQHLSTFHWHKMV